MMEELFLSVLNMSLTASYVILFIMLIRLPLKKAPKVISYALWGVAGVRLLCPFSFDSMYSLLLWNSAPIPQDIAYQSNPQISSGIKGIDAIVNAALPVPTVEASVNSLQIYTQIGAYIWIAGITVMLIYSIVSVLILKRRLKNSKPAEKNIYETENMKTPFVLGFLRPKIYIPIGLGTEERNYILLHEQTHTKRYDHIIKLFAFLLLTVHWFNPLVWIAFMLMSTDMELSCDERVIREIGSEIKKPYAASLLSLAAGKRILNGSPLAFGEGNVKGRIKNVLNYKKRAFWIVVVAVIAVIAVGIGLLVNPKNDALTQNEAQKIAEEYYPSAINITASGDQTVYDTIECYTFEVQLPESETIEILAVAKETGAIFSYHQDDGKWYAFTGAREKDPLTTEPLAFKTTETDLVQIGKIAFDEYMATQMSEKTSVEERIASYQLNDISLLAGDINEFCVSLNYDFTTDNDSFVNPGRGAKGKGTWADNYWEIRVKNIGEYAYEIVSTGTGGGGQGLTPYASQQTTLEPIAPGWSREQSVGADMASLDYASDDIVIFHGYFGLFVYDLTSCQIIRSLNLTPLKCEATQGDNYCEISVSTDGNTVQLHPMSSENMYVYTVSDNTLRETAYQPMESPFDDLVAIEEVINGSEVGNYSYQAVKFDADEFGLLHTYDWTLGTLSYARDDMMYALFDIKEN